MTTLDDLPFTHDDGRTPNGATGRQCRRHSWLTGPNGITWCQRCDRTRDEAAARRGRTNAGRGKRIQRQRIEGLGGRNLAGNNENLDGIGSLWRYESKSGGCFSERYWRWLKGIPTRSGEVGVLIVTDAPGPGHKARSMVVVSYEDWRDLHGEEASDD